MENNHHHRCGSTNDHSMSREEFEDVSNRDQERERERENLRGGEMFNRPGILKKKKNNNKKKTDIC